ncbi:DoxX family protein [Uliginosibacterium sp. sgz301328]|uniref:DoxX family protein n=1 Tax=Uliginosibacterium sp. sgz301328 TaxID=3243764 RepID=UPI00359DDBC5
MNNAASLVGRIGLALIFVLSGWGKLMNPAATAGYMEAMHVPTLLLWPTIALELLGGIALIVGFQTRAVAWLLAIFSVLAAVLFHANLADQGQQINFLKNLAMAGGFLVLATAPISAWSLDARRASAK